MRKSSVWLSGTLAMVLAVSACGGGSGSKNEGPIKVGAITPISGPAASIGAVGKAGFDLAVKHINDNGGVLGRKIEPILIDTAGDPVQATSAVQRLIQREGVDVILNAASSAESLGIADYMSKQKVLNLVGQSALDSLVDEKKYPFTYRFVPKTQVMAEGTGQIALEKGYKRVVVARDSLDLCKGVAAEATKTMTSGGLKPVAQVDFAADAADKSAAAKRIKDANPDAVVVCTLPGTYAKVFEALKRANVDVPVIAFITASVPQMIELGGNSLPSNLSAAVMDKPYFRDDLPQSKTFHAEYLKVYGKEPQNTTDVHVYDALLVWAAAVEAAGTTDPAKVKAQLDSGKEFSDTGSKPISFSATNHEAWKAGEVAPIYLVTSPDLKGAGSSGDKSWLDEVTLKKLGIPVPGN